MGEGGYRPRRWSDEMYVMRVGEHEPEREQGLEVPLQQGAVEHGEFKEDGEDIVKSRC